MQQFNGMLILLSDVENASALHFCSHFYSSFSTQPVPLSHAEATKLREKRVWSTMLLLNAIRGYIEAAIRPVIYLETAFQRCLIVGTPFFSLSLSLSIFSPLSPRSRLILPPPVILLRLSLCSSHGVPAPYVACELGKIPCLYLKRATMRGNSKKGNKAARL